MKRYPSLETRRYGRGGKSDLRAVSEALGTVILLGISTLIASILGVYIYMIEPLDNSSPPLFNARYDGNDLEIELLDGDDIVNTSQTFIRIEKNDQTWKMYSLGAGLSGTGKDGSTWSVGESWVVNVGGVFAATDSISFTVLDDTDIYGAGLIQSGLLLPDLKIDRNDIELDKTTPLVVNDNTTIEITVHNLGSASATNVAVKVFLFDYQYVDNITVGSITPGSSEKVIVNWTPAAVVEYSIKVTVQCDELEIVMDNNVAEISATPSIVDAGDNDVDLQITPALNGEFNYGSSDFRISPLQPIHGDYTTITITIRNIRGKDVLPEDDVWLYLHINDTAGYDFQPEQVVIHGHASKDFTFEGWIANPGERVEVTANISISPDLDINMDNNKNITSNISVRKKVLLVDDDTVSDGTPRDVVSFIRDAMYASGTAFDFYRTTQTTDPAFDSGVTQLSNYDIVLWICGYDTNTPLTPANLDALEEYLDDGGYLFIEGQGVIDSLPDGPDFPAGSFAEKYLGIDSFVPDGGGSGVPVNLYGVNSDPITQSETYSLEGITNFDGGESSDSGDEVIPIDTPAGSAGKYLVSASDNGFGVWKKNNATDYKTVTMPWVFSAMSRPFDRVDMVFRVLRWFGGNATIQSDLAISEQTLSTYTPSYLEDVNITVKIRNNGVTPHENIRVLFKVTGPDGVEKDVEPDFPDGVDNPFVIPYLSGNGTYVIRSKIWKATEVGIHSFRVIVDPYDEIIETLENNNDITYSRLAVREANVQFSVLVVDDDGSDTGLDNGTANITSSLAFLNYRFTRLEVPSGSDGPNVSVLKRYKTVIWNTGEDTDPLTDNDKDSISDYLGGNYPESEYIDTLMVGFILMGENVVDSLVPASSDSGYTATATGTLARDFLKIDSYWTNVNLSTEMTGSIGHDITHGLDLPLIVGDHSASDIIRPMNEASGLFHSSQNETDYRGVLCSIPTHSYRAMTIPWRFSNIDDGSTLMETNKQEVLYLFLRFMGIPDNRPELRTTLVDIELSDPNPLIGDSYIFTTKVFNPGGADASAVVRIYDGETLVRTMPVPVLQDGNTTIETIWVPLFSGHRDLRVVVDESNVISEVFNVSNNVAELPQDIYIFADDMENGTGNWEHESTILKINGETPLEFLDPEGGDVYIDIADSWASTSGTVLDEEIYHSYNLSFRIEENLRSGKQLPRNPLDVVFVFDTSASMGPYLDDMLDATFNTIDGLSVEDRAAFTVYSGGGQVQWYPGAGGNDRFEEMTHTGKQLLKDEMTAKVKTSAVTMLWDGIGEAYTILTSTGMSDDPANRTPVIISLSDGCDRLGNDEDPPKYNTPAGQLGNLEKGSDEWCPWHTLAEGIVTYDGHFGKYGGDSRTGTEPYGFWYTASSGSGDRKGLLGLPIPVYTIGFGLEHDPQLDDGSPPYFTETGTKPAEREDENDPGYSELHYTYCNATSGIGGPFYTEDFDDGPPLGSEWTHGANAGINDVTSNSGSYSMYTSGTETVTLDPIDLSSVSVGYISYWLRRGSDSLTGSENPDSGEDMHVEYLDDSLAWQQLAFFNGDGTQGQIYDQFHGIPDDAKHAAFQLRFRVPAGSADYDYWHIDDVEIAPAGTRVVGEVGTTSGDHNWQTVVLDNVYSDPIVFIEPLSQNDAEPCHTRLRNVDFNSFEWKVEEWDYQDGSHPTSETVTYIVVESGTHSLTDGSLLQAGKVTGDENFESVSLSQPYSSDPVVLTKVQTTNDDMPCVTRVQNVGTGGFEVMVQEEEDEGNHQNEEIGYITFESGLSSTMDGITYETGRTPDSVTHAWYTINFANTYAAAPLFAGWSHTYNGGDPCGMRYQNLGTTSVQVFMEEEESSDSETDHADEGVSFVVFEESCDILAIRLADITVGESGTVEYNLFSIANTSQGGRYLYAADSLELAAAFQEVSVDLGSLAIREAVEKPSVHSPVRLPDEGPDTRDISTRDHPFLNKSWMETETFSLEELSDATLTFWHRYDMLYSINGGVVTVGTNDGSGWEYTYIQPRKPYPGNLWLNDTVRDSNNDVIRWCYNGVSGNGILDWDQAIFDLDQFLGNESVRINFTYYNYGPGTGGGWWVDDVKVTVSRSNAEPVGSDDADQWALVNVTSGAASGTKAWWNGNDDDMGFKDGIDNSLITRAIDLTFVQDAWFEASFKFNINSANGRPSDGFRVEVSDDGGMSWVPLTIGPRSSYGLSGTEADGTGGDEADNGKSYTGFNDDTGTSNNDYWVSADTLERMSVNLTSWAGSVIKIRIRMIVSSDPNPHVSDHYDVPLATATFTGFYVDDVKVGGTTLIEQNTTREDTSGHGKAPSVGSKTISLRDRTHSAFAIDEGHGCRLVHGRDGCKGHNGCCECKEHNGCTGCGERGGCSECRGHNGCGGCGERGGCSECRGHNGCGGCKEHNGCGGCKEHNGCNDCSGRNGYCPNADEGSPAMFKEPQSLSSREMNTDDSVSDTGEDISQSKYWIANQLLIMPAALWAMPLFRKKPNIHGNVSFFGLNRAIR